MDFQVLGPLEARVDGTPIDLGEPQRRLVLALLLAHANSVVSTDRLVDSIWGDEPPESGRKIVQGYVSGLRKTLGEGDIIESRSPGYRLNVKPEQVDALLFEEGASQGASEVTSDPQRARQVLGEALSLWRGGPYEDLADYDALRPELTRLEQLHAAALEARVEADILSGQESAVTAELADLTGRFPLRERLWSLRMLALYRSGRQADALRVYDEARGVLAAEVGLEPSGELRLLEQRILDQDPVLDTLAAFEPEAALATTAERNPYKGLRAFEEADAADFYGREALVRRLREALERRSGTRLVVLAGPSGSGKSSVVGAGLIPILRADDWSIATMYPGEAPMEALAAAVDLLEAQPRSLLNVDQLEELITLAPEGSQEEFLDGLAELATGPDGPWVVVTVRADFLDQLLVHPRFARLVEPGLLLVTPLEDHEVRDVIVGPASRVGVTVEPDLVAAMVRDVAHRAPTLPLLEYALTDLYDRVGGGLLTLEALEAAGGISGALAKRAEELYAGLGEAGRVTTRQLFLRLVALTDEGEALRHRVTTGSLAAMPNIDEVTHVLSQHRLLTFDRDHNGQPTVEVAHEALLREWPRLAQWIDEAWDSLRMLQHLTDATAEWEANDRLDPYLLTGARLARYADWPDTELALSSTEQEFLAASREREEHERSRRRKRRRAVLAGFTGAAVIALALAIAALVARNDAADNAATAQENEALASSRELAASAVAVLGEDPELSVLLALEAIDANPLDTAVPGAGVLALREALQQHRLLARIPGNFIDARISPDGSRIFVSSEPDRSVMALDSSTGEVAWTYQNPSAIDAVLEFATSQILRLSLSPDGRLLAVSIPNFPAIDDQTAPLGAVGAGEQPARVVVLDAENGQVVHTLVFDLCRLSGTNRGFTRDGKWLAVGTGTEDCFEDPDATWNTLFDTTTWQEGPRLQIEGFVAEGVSFTANGSRVLVHDFVTNNAELRSFPEFELINQLPRGRGTQLLTPNGRRAVLDAPETDRRWLLVTPDTGTRIGYLDVADFVTGDRFQASPDGSMIGVITRTHDYVFSAENGELLVDLGNTGITNTLGFTADGSQLVTANSSGARIWDLAGRKSASGIALTVSGAEVIWMNPNWVVGTQDLAVGVTVDDGPTDREDAIVTVVVDPETGATIEHLVGDSIQLPDGRFVVAQRSLGTEERRLGPLVVLDPDSDSIAELDGCVALLEDLVGEAEIDCPGPFFSWYAFDRHHLVSSVDGSFFAATSYAPPGSPRSVRVWDSTTLEVRNEFSIPFIQQAFAAGPSWIAAIDDPEARGVTFTIDVSITVYDVDTGAVIAELDGPSQEAFAQQVNDVTNDGAILFVADLDGGVVAFDTSSWERVAQWQAHGAFLRGFAVSPDGARLATTGQDDLVKVWDISGLIGGGSLAGPPPLLDRIPAEFPSDAAWLSSDRLAVFLAEGVEYLDVSLNVDDLVAEATQRLTRSFSIEECAVYQIDPCPTLEQIRSR